MGRRGPAALPRRLDRHLAEGRDIWLVTVTNFETGPHDEKPALLVEANIHSIEVTGCTAALHLLHKLLTECGSDEKVTLALDTRTFYVVPRLNPDGAELALAERPRYVRSSVRKYPLPEPEDGLQVEDLDGDGRILQMRVADPNGNWKKHEQDERLMVRRDPDEFGGEYYRMLLEGSIRNYDGVQIKIPGPPETLDLNRNFPGEWGPEAEQRGSRSVPGVRARDPRDRAGDDRAAERLRTLFVPHVQRRAPAPVRLHPDDHFPPVTCARTSRSARSRRS